MSSKGRGSRGRRLSEEDETLWHHVARGIRPVRMKARVPETCEPDEAAMPPRRSQPHETRIIGHHPPPPVKAHPVSQDPRPHKAPPLADFDRRTARRIAKGTVDIEARLDLHGMRQSEAHGALRAFLVSAYGRGLKVVLIITGKGAPQDVERGDLEASFDSRERGVLRRNVPRWLAEPELRQLVVSHTAAHVRHGGDGAMYVYLRSRGRG